MRHTAFVRCAESLLAAIVMIALHLSAQGAGRRVSRLVNGVTTVYVYDALGQLAAEYASAAPTAPPCLTCYLTADHLGSTRVVTKTAGAVVSRHDYLPFGEEIFTANRTTALGYTPDNITQKFTGKERDGESGLDFFGVDTCHRHKDDSRARTR